MQRSQQSWPARPEHVGAARRAASAAAMSAGAEAPVLDAVRLAVSEAVSNVVMHGYRARPAGTFTVAVDQDGDELRVTVRDQGGGMAPRPDSPGAGYGLPLIESVTESLSVNLPPGGGTEVCMTFGLHALSAA